MKQLIYELNGQKYLLVYYIIFSSKPKRIMKKYTWWTKPNPEGVSNKDVFQVILFEICLLGFLIGMWFIITSFK